MIDITPVPTVAIDTETWTRTISLADFLDCITRSACCPYPVACYVDRLPIISSDNFTFGFNFDVSQVRTIQLDGTVISDVTGSWKTGAKQITVKGSEAPACFSVLINDDCALCFAYEKIPDNACGKGTLLIESTYTDRDCFGNRYGSGYTNAMRIYADMRYITSSAEVERDEDENVVSNKIRMTYGVRFLQLLHERGYPIAQLTNVTLRGFDLKVTEPDGTETEFDIFSDSVDINLDYDYWLPNFELTQKPCELDFGCE